MTNRLFASVDKMPFAGKYAIRESISKYVEADASEEKKQYLKTSAYLGVMAVAHAYQSYMGYQASTHHLEHLNNTGDTFDSVLLGIDAIYTGVNAAVTARQIALLKRVNEVRKKKAAEQESIAARSKDQGNKSLTRKLSQRGALAALAITVSGQAIFAGSYIDSSFKEVKSNCIETATEIYRTYEDAHPDLTLKPIDEFTSGFCL